jgi:RecB family exonuclease
MLHRRLIIVDTPFAMQMARVDAARTSDNGIEILTMPLLAARLAGGFRRPVGGAQLAEAVAVVLKAEPLVDLNAVRDLPGMPKALIDSLSGIWRENLTLSDLVPRSTRAADLHRLDRSVRARLPSGLFAPPDLAAAALANIELVSKLFETVTLMRMLDIDPVWRPLINAISGVVSTTWHTIGKAERGWFAGNQVPEAPGRGVIAAAEICADPRAEVVEALRWARRLLSTGTLASEIAMVAASPAAWDEHTQVLATSNLQVHFSHGRPALGTAVGQCCAALADVLINGLSQDRIRRLQRLSPYLRKHLPRGWMVGIGTGAGLFTAAHWRRALASAPTDMSAVTPILMPVLDVLEKGLDAAAEVGELLLSGKSLALWQDALRRAPAAALMMTLKALRVADEFDPGNSIVWGPASHLVGAPRTHMRLLGVTARSWPRAAVEDPILPMRISGRQPVLQSRTELDRQHFDILAGSAAASCAISCSHRSAEGSLQAPSPLWPTGSEIEIVRSRTRIPNHAYSEADRLLARLDDAKANELIASASTCWADWHRPEVTAHDGRFRTGHPAIERTLARLQSATSLRRLLRDPLGFVWQYGLELHAPRWAIRPLELDPVAFGELVHALIKTAIDLLEPAPGLSEASSDQIRDVIRDAARLIQDQWPLERAVPPPLLWRYTLEDAVRRTKRALTPDPSLDEALGKGARSWGEITFGSATAGSETRWTAGRDVTVDLGLRTIRLEGRIDRLDIGADGRAVRISDYKTGAVPGAGHGVVLDEGREVQRTLYAMAVQQLLGGDVRVASRLVYLDPNMTISTLDGDRLSAAETTIVGYLTEAISIVERGDPPPGPGAVERFNQLRLLLPADLDRYLGRKFDAFGEARSGLVSLWSRK